MKYLYLFALLFAMTGCEKDDNPGGGSEETDTLSLYSFEGVDTDVVNIDDYLMCDGTSGVSMSVDDLSGLLSRATLLSGDEDMPSLSMEFNELGQPTLIVIDDTYIVLGNHSGSTVDISCVNGDGETLIMNSVPTSVDWDQISVAALTRSGFVDSVTEGVLEDFKTIGIGVAYGLMTVSDIYTVFIDKSSDKTDALFSIAKNMSKAIVTALPEAKEWKYIVNLVTEDEARDLYYLVKDTQDLLSDPSVKNIASALLSKISEKVGEYLLGKLTNETKLTEAIDNVGAGETYTPSDSSGTDSTDSTDSTGSTDAGDSNNNILSEVPDGYIGLYSAQDLYDVRNDLSAKYIMMRNISLASFESWTPIGSYVEYANISTAFVGTFDGNGNSISGLVINSADDRQALFGYTAMATIKNLTIKSPNIVGGSYTAALVAFTSYCTISTTISNCGVEGGSVSGIDYVGSIFGLSGCCDVSSCYNEGTAVSGENYIGGIAGGINATYTTFTTGDFNYYSSYANVSSCYNTGRVSGDTNVGGIVGRMFSTAKLTAAYNRGTVSGTDRIGGVAGYVERTYTLSTYRYPVMSYCYNVATVTATGDYAGGVVGYNYEAQYSTCYFIDQLGDSATLAFGYSTYGYTSSEYMLLSSISELNSAINTSYYVAGSSPSVDLPSLKWE